MSQRATTAPLRDIVAIILDCECKGRDIFLQNKFIASFFLIYLVDTIFFKYFAHSFNQNVQYNADDSF